MGDSPRVPAGSAAQSSIEQTRQTGFEQLSQQAVRGDMTLGQYAERAVAIEQAATTDEIQALVGAGAIGTPATRRPSWLVSVLARVDRRGQWQLRERLRVVSVFTVQTLDLSTARLEAPQSVITISTAFGGASVIAPQGASLDVSGFALFGGRNDNRAEVPPFPGSPVIRIRAFSIFGGVRIEDRVLPRNTLDPIRAENRSASS